MESDADVDLGIAGHGADELWAGGLRGGLWGDDGLGAHRVIVGK